MTLTTITISNNEHGLQAQPSAHLSTLDLACLTENHHHMPLHQPFAFILDAGFSLGTCFPFLPSGSASPDFSTMSTYPHQAQHPLSGAEP